jgi:glycosyltransferase involved in cell wall biosynthesis
VAAQTKEQTVRCLWLTLADPDPPHNGQYVYSGGLIRGIADAGAEVTVLGLQRPDGHRVDGQREGNVVWRLVEHKPLARWTSVKSRLPNIANRCRTPEMVRLLDGLLNEGEWNAIILDGISAGWALKQVMRWRRRTAAKTKMIYISHNHEESLRRRVANEQTRPVRRVVMRIDALKVMDLERAMVNASDLITAITGEDAALYQERRSGERIEVLTPGFIGKGTADRVLGPTTPRRAILVGSFDWIAKRMNLEEFVSIADPILAAYGIELHVIGSAEKRFLDAMRRRVVMTHFVGPVESVDEHMRTARIAIVPERSGGGFKLKVLDYVFARLPIFALEGSVAGMPLTNKESILLYPNQEALALGIVQSIDNLDRLNQIQDSAYRACADQFDWSSRGAALATAVAQL